MSEDVRKNHRTQGKYNDGKVRKSFEKKQRESVAAKDSSDTRWPKRNSDGKKCMNSKLVDEGVSTLKYEENSNYSFSQLDDAAKPEEIKGRVELVLSKTDNGESKIFYEPQFIHEDEGFDYFDRLYKMINWNTKNIIIHGIEYPQPRLVAWFGPFPYSYSGTTLEPAEMPDAVMEIKEKVEKYLACNDIKTSFNSVLINLYRDGKDSVAWHSDDELMLGVSPTIASVSLGEIRKFEIRPKRKNYDEQQSPPNQICKYFVHLIHGSLIVMTGSMQDDWQHRIPKEYHDKNPRINLTFRTVFPLEKAPVKEINLETEIKQSYGRNISSKTSNSEFKLDEEHFPSLQKDVDSAKSNVTYDMYDPHKNFNPKFKKHASTEEYWDNEICDNKQNVENVVTHKNTSVFNKSDEDCKSKYDGKNNFSNRKPPEKWCDIESICDNEKIAYDDKTVTKKLWGDEHDSSVNGFQENNTVEEQYEMKSHKSVNHSSMNIRANFYKEIDRNMTHDKEASLTAKISQQYVTVPEECSLKSCNIKTNSYINATQENDLNNEKSQNACHFDEDNSWMDSSEECDLDMKKTAKMAQNTNTKGYTNSYINVTQEDDLNKVKSPSAYPYVEGNSWGNSSEKSNKKPVKIALNVDAKEFVPTNIKSNDVSHYSGLKLEDLINCEIDSLEGKNLQDHAQSLKKEILERFRTLNRFGRNELEFLLEITDGSQVDKNQRLISNRICRIVQNNLIKLRQPPNVLSSFDRSSRPRGYENQGYYSDKGKRYPNQNRSSKSNRNRF